MLAESVRLLLIFPWIWLGLRLLLETQSCSAENQITSMLKSDLMLKVANAGNIFPYFFDDDGLIVISYVP